MTINLNGVEIYSAQEVEARIREAIAGKDKKVIMENLPIGTVVKVVGDTSGHCHDFGEILPITEVGVADELSYRLDDRISGWVAVDDIEFVSFPEEEESTSGDEGLTVDDICEGDSVKFLDDHTDGYGDTVQKGHCATVIAIQDGDILIGTPTWQSVKHEDIPTVLTKIDEDEDESEIKAGDIVIATEDEFDITEGVEYEVKEFKTGTLYFLDDVGDIRHVSVHEENLRKKSVKRGFNKRFNGFEIGDILLSHIGSHQITDGKHYEVVAVDCDGDAVIMDDNGRVYYIDVSAAGDGKFEVL